MTVVSANGDHRLSQSEMADYEYQQRLIGREKLARHFQNADDMDWEHLFKMLPDSGHGKFWRSVLSSVRAELGKH